MHANPPDDRVPLKAYVISGLGLICVLAVMFVSACLNWSFGTSLGRTPFDATIYGIASVAADGFKCLAPFFFFAAIRNKMWSHALAAFAVWAMTTVYALTGAFGHAALNRTDTSSKREVASGEYSALVKDRARIEQEIAWIPQHRPAATVAAEIEAKKTERMFRLTNGCAASNSGAARTYCSDLHKLEAERASATQGAELRGRLDHITTQLRPYATAGAATQADPQVAFLSKLTGADATTVTTGLLLLIVGLLEIVSGLGLYTVAAHFPDKPRGKRKVETPAAHANDDVPLSETGTAAQVLQFPLPKQVETAALEAAPVMETVAEDFDADGYEDGADAIAVMVGKPDFSQFPVRKDEAEPDLRRILAATGGRIPSQKFLRGRWGVAKGTICKWVNSWDWVELEIDGKTTVVKEANHRLAA